MRWPTTFLHASALGGARLRAFVCVAALCVTGTLLLGGCGGERGAPLHEPPGAAFQSASGTRAEALGALDSLRQGALRGAFKRLRRFGYRQRVRTEQHGDDGRVVAFEERAVRYAAGDTGAERVLRSDSSGAFDFGALGRVAGRTSAGAPATDLARQVFPEDLSFLSERNRYAFQYRLLPDTSLPGDVGRTRVVAVRARPGPDGEGQTVRSARLYLEAGTDQLVALRLHRVRQSMLFDEETRQFVRLRRTASADSAAWVPAATRFRTRLELPLRPARRFQTSATYDQYRAPSS